MLFGPKKILGVYLSCPFWRPKSIRCSKWLLFAILEDQFLSWKTWKTLHAIYRRLAWALNILFVGLMPAKDCDGNSMSLPKCEPGQYLVNKKIKFALTEIKGDWVFHKQLFRFKSSWKGGSTVPVCFLCRAMANQSPFYFDIGPNAPCWSTQYTCALLAVFKYYKLCNVIDFIRSISSRLYR